MTFLDRLSETYERSLHLFGIHGRVPAILVALFVLAFLVATYSTVRLFTLVRQTARRS